MDLESSVGIPYPNPFSLWNEILSRSQILFKFNNLYDMIVNYGITPSMETVGYRNTFSSSIKKISLHRQGLLFFNLTFPSKYFLGYL